MSMDQLLQTYGLGLTNEQIRNVNHSVNDIVKDSITKILNEATPNILKKVLPLVKEVNNPHGNLSNIPPTSNASTVATNYIRDNKEYIRRELTSRNNVYYQYVRCTSFLDLYNDCLEEEPLHISKMFRNDKKHCMLEEVKRCNERMYYQKMRNEMEILTIRRDEFRRRIRDEDEKILSHFSKTISNKDVLREVNKIWEESVKKDEGSVNFKWVRKIESARKAFETDKQNIRSESNAILPKDENNDFDKFDDHAEQESFSQNDHSSTSQVDSHLETIIMNVITHVEDIM